MRYRVTINIRRKGQGYMDGMEFKSEHHDDLDHLLDEVVQFITDSIGEDMEGISDDEDNEPAFA